MDKRIEASIGKAYSPTGKGPESFNCWSFVSFVLGNSELPTIDALDTDHNIANISKHRGSFIELGDVKPYCIVLLGRKGVMSHVGVYHPSGIVFHCMQGAGVVGHRLEHLGILGFDTKGFYEWIDNASSSYKE